MYPSEKFDDSEFKSKLTGLHLDPRLLKPMESLGHVSMVT